MAGPAPNEPAHSTPKSMRKYFNFHYVALQNSGKNGAHKATCGYVNGAPTAGSLRYATYHGAKFTPRHLRTPPFGRDGFSKWRDGGGAVVFAGGHAPSSVGRQLAVLNCTHGGPMKHSNLSIRRRIQTSSLPMLYFVFPTTTFCGAIAISGLNDAILLPLNSPTRSLITAPNSDPMSSRAKP
jgi:hypothetical protein